MLSRSRNLRRRGVVIAVLSTLFVVTAVPLALVKSHAYRILGGYVKRVDPAPFATAQERIVITGVSVLSPDGESMLPDRRVVIDQGRIVEVSPAAAPGATAPVDARRIDGTGKYLVPGLVDAHVHLREQPNDLLLYVANGVTHVRDLKGSRRDLALRDQIAQGRIGPHLYVASPLLFSAGPIRGAFEAFTSSRRRVAGPDRAEAVVQSLMGAGYDALKTYADLDIESYRAINRAAAVRGMHTVGHLPDGFRLDELAHTQQRELAHIEEIVKVLQVEFRTLDRDDYREAFAQFTANRADAIIDDLLANDITVNTTLWFSEVVGNQAFALVESLRRLPLEYANPAMLEGSPFVESVGWLPGRNQFEAPANATAEERARLEGQWAARAEAHRVLFRRMVERGVRIVAGTDATSHLVIPGFSLHDELQSLVRNGMTPAEALRAATATPAALMDSNAGVVAAGYRADLLLLAADPLVDIANTRAIDAVILNGRLLQRERLDRMLEAVAQANAASRHFDLAAYR